MTKIKSILAREILDSRGNPTVEVDVLLDDGKPALFHFSQDVAVWRKLAFLGAGNPRPYRS